MNQNLSMPSSLTAGPWRIENERVLGARNADGWSPVVAGIKQETAAQIANGRLICSAPELLTTCLGLNRFICSQRVIGPNEKLWMLTKLLRVSVLATEGDSTG